MRSIAFIRADIEKCVDTYFDWKRSISEKIGVRMTTSSSCGTVEDVVRRLYPLTSMVSRRSLFIPTKGEWTAYLDNGHAGTDGAAVAHMARILPCKTVHARYTPPNSEGAHPATILEIYGPQQTDWLNVIRSVAAISDDGRWEFHQGGQVQEFEDVERYSARRIKDRFTGEMLERYLKAMGIDAYNPEFYLPHGAPASLVEGHGPTPPGMREFSLLA